MDTAIIKGRLHEYIESADSEHLAAIYILLEKEMPGHTMYDEETLKMLYQRVENDLNGTSRSYTIEEVMRSVRASGKA